MEPGQYSSNTLGKPITLCYRKDIQISTIIVNKVRWNNSNCLNHFLKETSSFPEILSSLLASHLEATVHN